MIYERTVAENAWELEEGLYRILLPLPWDVPFVNAYLVACEGQFLLIDAGWHSRTSLRALGRAMKAIGVPPHGLTQLLLTHGHPDHASGAGAVHAHWGGSVSVHPAARRHHLSTEEMADWARREGLAGEPLERLLGRRREPMEPLPEDVEHLQAGGPLRFGACAFDVLHMPGHCPGQVVLHERGRGWLFTADQLLTPQGPNVWYQSHREGDPLGEYLESLEATGRIAADLVLPGHGAPWRGGPAQGAAEAIAFQRDYIARVEGCVEGSAVSSWRVAQRLAAARGRRAEDVSELAEVLAALVHLEAEGKIGRTQEGGWVRV